MAGVVFVVVSLQLQHVHVLVHYLDKTPRRGSGATVASLSTTSIVDKVKTGERCKQTACCLVSPLSVKDVKGLRLGIDDLVLFLMA
jgi:hypothetical protein